MGNDWYDGPPEDDPARDGLRRALAYGEGPAQQIDTNVMPPPELSAEKSARNWPALKSAQDIAEE